jgi:O-antigen ligase
VTTVAGSWYRLPGQGDAVQARPIAAGGIHWLGYLLMFAMVFTPVTHNSIKLSLAAVLLPAALFAIAARGSIRLQPAVLLWFIFYACIGGVFVLRGYLDGAPGALHVAAIYVAFPLLYAVFVDAASDLRVIRGLIAATVLGCIATSAYMLLFALWAAGIVPHSLFFVLDEAQGIGFHDGFVQMRLYSISGLVFLVPFVAAALVSYTDPRALPISRRWLWVALLFGLCGTFLSGRKVLMLTVAATPLLIGLFNHYRPAEERARSRRLYWRFIGAVGIIVVAAAVYLPATGAFDLDRFMAMIASAFDFRGDVGANERLKQLHGLLGQWAEKPLMGWGWGQGARGIVRSGRPWEYELQYALLLFSTGLVGAVAYASGIIWIYIKGLRVIRSVRPEGQHVLPLLVGLTSILVAHGSNPYLVSAGNMWMIFLPVAAINSWMRGVGSETARRAEDPSPTAAGAIPVAEHGVQTAPNRETQMTLTDDDGSAIGPRARGEGVTLYRLLAIAAEGWRLTLVLTIAAAAIAFAVVSRQARTYTARMELTTVATSQAPRISGAMGAMLTFGSGGIEAKPALVMRLMRSGAVLNQVALSPYGDAAQPLIRSIVAEEGAQFPPPEEYAGEVDKLLRTSIDRDAGTIGLGVTHVDSAVARTVATRVLEATANAFARASRAQASQLRQAQEARVEDAREKLRVAERRLVAFLDANRVVPPHSPLVMQRRQLDRDVDVAQTVYMQVVNEHESAVGKELEETPALVVLDPVPATIAPNRRHLGLKIALAGLLGLLIGIAISLARRLPDTAGIPPDDRLYLRRALGDLPLLGRVVRSG